MSCEESITLRVEDIGHLHDGPSSRLSGLPLETGPRHHGRRYHVQLLKGIGGRVEVPSREVEIDGRVRQVGVTQQELNRPQVGARFEQMRRVRVPQRMRRDALVDPRLPRGQAHGFPDHLRRDRGIGTPAVVRPGEEVRPRSHPPVVLAQGGEERRTEGDVAIPSAFALLDAEHHALAIDVADFELARFAAAQAGAVERQQQRAVIEILRPGDQRWTSSGLRTTGRRSRCFGYGRSSRTSRRFRT